MNERELLLINAAFWSPGHTIPGPPPHALAVRGRRIARIGPEQEVTGSVPGHADVVDLGGATVVPGFIDCHVHLTQTGLDAMGVNVGNAGNLARVLEIIDAHVQQGPLVRAWGFDPESLPGRRWPAQEELDALSGPVFLSHAEIHACMLNAPALKLLGPGIPPGVLTGEANSLARRRLAAVEDDGLRRRGLAAAAAAALARGVTTVHAMEGGELFGDQDLEHIIDVAGSLPVDVVVYPQTWDVDRAVGLGLPRIGGCILLDGSPGVRTAAMFSDYPGHPVARGILYRTQEDVDRLARRASRAGLQLALHASGEAAIDQALTALERAGPLPHPPRIEHFEVPAPGQAERAARVGSVLSVQPAFDHYWAEEYVEVLGPDKGLRANPVASCIRAGAVVAGGSDAGVTPIDPLLGIGAALTHSRPDERPTLEEAFCMFTSWAAAAGCTPDRGRLAAGARADLAILDRRPWEISDMGSIRVLATMVAGRLFPALGKCGAGVLGIPPKRPV